MRIDLVWLTALLAAGCSHSSGQMVRTPGMPMDCPGDDPPFMTRQPILTVTKAVTAVLADSGASLPLPQALPPLADAVEPDEPKLTAALHVSVPNAACPRLTRFVNLAIAIPTNSTLREIEAYWNGMPLVLVDQGKTDVIETPHSYGEQMNFFKPIFSVDGVPAGMGTLEVRGYDGSHGMVASQTIAGLEVVAPPPPLKACQIAAAGHPRLWLTKERLDRARARDPHSSPAARYQKGIDHFLNGLSQFPDPTSAGFNNAVYSPESFIPSLALCYQLNKGKDDALAKKCAAPARTLALHIAAGYRDGSASFGRDSGYDIRFSVMRMMIAYDWLYDYLSADDRSLLAVESIDFVNWYHDHGYAESHPYENYYAGYLQGLVLTAFGLAGDTTDALPLLGLLRQKLNWEMPVMDQRLCGGDWPEGWNYGPLSVQEMALAFQTLKDFGEDWSALFDFLQRDGASLAYQMSPDFSELRSFGGYSGSLAHKTSPALLAILSSTMQSGGLAARVYTNALANPNNDLSDGSSGAAVWEMLYADTGQTANVASLPLSFFASGTGRFFSRSSLSDTGAYQVTAETMDYYYDHYGYTNGDVRLYRGADCLVCPAAYRGANFRGEEGTTAFSTWTVNGKHQKGQNRNNQVLYTLEHGDFAAIGMRFESSFALGGYEEHIIAADNPLDYLIREAVHLRPGTLVVRDLHRRRHAGDTMTALWHLGPTDAPQAMENGVYKVGGLMVSTWGSLARAPSFAADPDGNGNTIGTLMTDDLPSSTDKAEMVTVFSESDRLVSYQGGVVRLSSGRCVTFSGGTVSVGNCP